MTALDARHIYKPGRTANQRAAGEGEFRYRLQTTLRNRPRAIGHTATALQHLRNQWMMLETLEFHVGIKMRILVVQMHHIANGHQIVFEVIHEAATTSLGAKWPAHGVGDLTLLVVLRFHLPQLFHAQAVFLWLFAVRQIETIDDLLGQRSTNSLGYQNIFSDQFHARLIVGSFRTVLFQPHDTSDHPAHRTGF